jgi:Tfp pilus assembly protein PilE
MSDVEKERILDSSARQPSSSFSSLELLVVIAIIAILAAILFRSQLALRLGKHMSEQRSR